MAQFVTYVLSNAIALGGEQLALWHQMTGVFNEDESENFAYSPNR